MSQTKLAELQAEEARLRHRGDYKGALRVLDQMISLDDRYSPVFNNKGGILLMQKRYTEALQVLERAVALKPNNGQALNNLAYCYYSTGHPEKAIPLYRESLKKGYTHEGVHYNLGLALLASGQLDEALNEWELVLRSNPLYNPLVSQLYQFGQAVGAVVPGDEVDETTIGKIRRGLRNCEIEIIHHRAGPEMTLIIVKGNSITPLSF